jgi:hypothetical protein
LERSSKTFKDVLQQSKHLSKEAHRSKMWALCVPSKKDLKLEKANTWTEKL